MINKNLNAGFGDVVLRDSLIYHEQLSGLKLAAVRHANGRDWWIIIEDFISNNHQILLLDPTGLNIFRKQEIGIVTDSIDWSGNSLFSPDGSKFIKYLRNSQIQLFDFDKALLPR